MEFEKRLILYKTKYLTLKAYKRENKPDWVYVSRDNAKNVVVILPVIKKEDKEYILFLITRRPPLIAENKAEFCLELPSGLVGDENEFETINEAFKKELLEETGLVADEFEILNKLVSTSGGLTSETSTIAKAKISNSEIVSNPISDGGVIIDRVLVEKNEIKNFIKQKENEGFAMSSQMLAALYYLKE